MGTVYYRPINNGEIKLRDVQASEKKTCQLLMFLFDTFISAMFENRKIENRWKFENKEMWYAYQ